MYFLEQIKLNTFFLLFQSFNEVGGWNEIPNASVWDQTEVTLEGTLDRLEKINDLLSSTMDLESNRRDELLWLLDDEGTGDLLEWLEGTDEDIAELAFDALSEWENPNLWPDLSPTEIAQSNEAIRIEMTRLQNQIDSWWDDSQESVRRLALYSNLLQIIEEMQSERVVEWEGWVSWVGWDVLANGQQFVDMNNWTWIHEDEAQASELFWYWHDAWNTAWCGGFVTRVCNESWYDFQTSHPLRAKSFIECVDPVLEQTHTCFKTPDGRALWGNQSDRATIQDISRPLMWWVMPQDVWNPEKTYTRDKDWAEAVLAENVPAWAIMVFPRGGGSNWS